MTILQQWIIILMVILGTMLTRFLPFYIFKPHKPTPEIIQYLGRILPPAVFGLLVVYSLKDTKILGGSHGLPELIAIIIIMVIHLWKRNMLLSIAVGTMIYMVCVQVVF